MAGTAVVTAGLVVLLMKGSSATGATGGGIKFPPNWKTSVAGVLTAFFAFVMFSPEDFAQWPWVMHLAKFATIGGLASVGLLAKDSTTHSTVQQMQEATVKAAEVPKEPVK